MNRILVVDDEPGIGWSLQEYFRDLKYEVQVSGSVEAAMESAGRFLPDAILLDVRLPGRDGLSAMDDFRRQWGPVPIIVMTAFGDLSTAVRAMNLGAFEYLTKPFDLDQAGTAVTRALESVQTAISDLSQAAPAAVGESLLLGKSPAMQEVFKSIALLAPTNVPVLITGETGTGKELAAAAIHRHSLRANGPFVPVCLAALSSSVVESELFGHVRGAFTGAVEDRPGLIELANEGTLFLDEIGDTSLEVQVKLLRFLETRQYTRVGSGQMRMANVRVVAATHRQLSEQISRGEFREDLLFRLRGFELRMPPLRERPDDIPLLAESFCAQACPTRSRSGLTAAFCAALQQRLWYGNVRELRTAIEHAAILSRGGSLRPEHLPEPLSGGGPNPGNTGGSLQGAIRGWLRSRPSNSETPDSHADLYREFLAATEPALFTAVLEACQGNRAAAARSLGLDRTTLRTKLRMYGLDNDTA